MHKLESVLEDETQKDFEIETGQLISARRPQLVIINKNKNKKKERTCRIVDFAVTADHWIKIQEKW